MDLGIHHARQDMQAAAIDHLGGGSLPELADFSDAAIGDGDIAYALAVLVDHGAGFQNQIVVLAHRSSYPVCPCAEGRARAVSKRPSQTARALSFMAWRLTFRCNMSQEIFT